jgi:acetyl-CoA/propionyl-CoA carboxylase carboxyl transferase subunit
LHARLAEHERIAGGVGRAVQLGVVDELVEPSKTRRALVEALARHRRTRVNIAL